MVLGTLCPLIIPFLALSSISGIHPVREPVRVSAEVVMTRSADGSDLSRNYPNLFGSGWDVASIR